MKTTDPGLFVIPEGFIELTRARTDTVTRCFGRKHTSRLTPDIISAEAANPQAKAGRTRRWTLAQRLLLRALRRGRLHAYLLRENQPVPLDASYWHEWEPSWRPFEVDPLGKQGERIHLLRGDEWESWLSGCGAAARQGSRTPVRTGTAGRPSSKHLYTAQLRAMHQNGTLPETVAATARALLEWLTSEHPDAPRPGPNALENNIRAEHRKLRGHKITP
jgi:hypothetical protein